MTRFTSYRLKEIEILKNDALLSKDVRHKCLFQLLPRHMRRRTMGYIRKRLPKSIRSQATIKAVGLTCVLIAKSPCSHSDSIPKPSKVNKRPSRKYRRRPSNLLSEYERRKRPNKMWLETHIWHAKRFHMATKYGYRLALLNNNKNLRQASHSPSHHRN